MKRLTKKFDGVYITNCDNCLKQSECYGSTDCVDVLVDRLAAYEDTGLEPEEINGLCEMDRRAKMTDMLRDEEYFGISIDRLRELAQAEKEGRCVVLDTPRKPLVWGDVDHATCPCPDCGEDLMGIPYGERMVLQCPVCGQYLDATKIVAPEEAEAALAGKEKEK